MVDVAPFVATSGDSAPPAGPGILQSAQAADVAGALGEPIGLIREAVGEVLLLHADGTTETVSSGMPVFVDDLVSTGPGGGVEIVFVDGTTFSLGANGQMRLDNLVFDPASGNNGLDATVVKGSFIFITGQVGSAEGEGVRIDTPAGTIGIRGTSGAGAQDPLTGAWIFTLFRDPDGTLSRFTVTNPAGAQLLDQEFESTQIAGQFIRPSQTFVLSPGEAAALFGDALAVLQEQFPQLQNPERRGELNDIMPAAGEQFALSFGIPLPTAASLGDLYGLDLLAQTLANLLAAGGLGATELSGGGGSVGGSSTETFLPVPPDNQLAPPVDVDLDANEIEEGAETGAVANIQALANDPRFTGPVTYSLLDDAGGAFTIDPVSGIVTVADGSLLDFESGGTITIVVGASDGIHSSAAPLTITLTDVNEAPTAIELSNFVVGENQPGAVIGTLTAVDVDKADSAKFSVSDDRFEVVDGDLKLKDGVSLDHESSDKISVSVTATDKGGLSFSQTFEITVADADDPPNALPDAYAVDEDGALAVSALDGVLANDGDPDGDELTATLVDGPAHGKLTFSPDGSFTYTPASDYNGPDSFTYEASDGTADSTVVTVNLSVAPKNDTPVAEDDAYEIAEDGELMVPGNAGVLANDSDVDGDDLSAVLVSGPSHGALTLNPDGSFTYTPDEDFTGEDGFAYKASDGALSSDPVTVRLTIGAVPDAPTANDDSGTVLEEGPAAAINLTGNDTDPDSGDDLEVTALGLAGAKGLATIAADGEGVVYDPDGKFEFLAAGETATDTFTYTVSDGHGGTDTATVTVTVTGANDGPTANDDSDTISEDGPATAINLAGNDSDPDASDDLDVTALGLAETKGKVTIAADGEGVIYNPDGKFDFLADGETATDTFTYTLSDGHGGTDTATVTVTITGANDGPTAISDSDSLAEDGLAKSIKLTGNDSDPDANDDLEVTALDLTGTKGKVTIAADGEGAVYDSNGQFELLADGETAIDVFTYTVSDGHGGTDTATVTVTITGANDGPTANDDSDAIAEDGPAKAINLTGNDSDPDASDDLEVTALGLAETLGKVTIAADGEGVVYDSNGKFEFLADGETATDVFTYTVSDGHGGTDTATVTVTITGANDAPTANDDSDAIAEDGPPKAINLTGNDSDPDASDDLEVTALGLAATLGKVTIAADGEGVIYDANGKFDFLADGQTATDTFVYTVSDGHGGTDTATVTVTITGANDTPQAEVDSYRIDEDGKLSVKASAGVLANDTDVDGDELTALLVAGPAHGTLTLNPDGSFVYAPGENFSGEDSFTYKASDGTDSSETATVTIDVKSVNDAPEAGDDGPFTTGENEPVVISIAELLANDIDTDGDILVLTKVEPLTGGSAIIEGGNIIFQPAHGFDGEAKFAYTVSDGQGGTDTAVVTVDVADDAPTATDDSAETADRTTQAINLVIIFDRSGSMGQSPGVPGFSTRQELANAAVAALFEAYGSIATLNIQIVDFAGTASQSGWLTTAEAANAYLAGLTPSGGTNYAAAIQTAMSAYASAPPADQAEVYFLSDGEPNAGQSLREAGLVGTWEAFLSNPANNIDRAFAVGIGGIQPGDPDLADVAFPNNDPSTLIVVTDESQLVDTLVGTVANAVSGNVLENDQFGADGPGNGGFGLLSITVDNVKYTYDGTEITAEGNPSEPPLIAGAKLVVVTGLGGTLEFHFDSGDYNYVAPDVTKTASEEFAYVIVDGDGTMDDATLHIDITDSGIVTRDPSTIIGKDGPDSLTGGAVDDVMSGGNGNDTILGNAGNDHIQGGAGDDSLSGGTGADVVIGGAGNDSIRLIDILNFAAINGGGTVAVSLAGDAGDRLLFDGKLDLTSAVGDRIEGIETLSMADGSGDDGLIIAAADIIGIGTGRFDPPGSFGNFGTLSDAPTVRIDGDKVDTLTLADGGWVKFTGTAAPLVPGYDLYVHDAPGGAVAEDAYLLVQSIITVNVG